MPVIVIMRTGMMIIIKNFDRIYSRPHHLGTMIMMRISMMPIIIIMRTVMLIVMEILMMIDNIGRIQSQTKPLVDIGRNDLDDECYSDKEGDRISCIVTMNNFFCTYVGHLI